MTKEIPLTKGKMAIVDDDDFEELSKYKWNLHPKGYGYSKIFGKNTLMHRFIIGDIGDSHVDHANGNGLDNRRINLRPCTRSENMANRRGCQRNNTSGYCGVAYHKKRGRWRAEIGLNGNKIFLGFYDTPEAAARAYDAAARVAFGEFAKLNFD